MTTIIAIIVFIVGLTFGSFGSVLLTRLEKVSRKTLNSVFFGRSICPQCKKILKPRHLFPLFSFVFQKGKCAFCQNRIPWKYFILELGSGIVFLATYLILHFFVGDISRAYLIFWLTLNWLLWLLIVFDIEKFELHVPIWGMSVALVLLPQFFGQIGNYRWAFFGSILFGLFFYLLYFAAKIYVRKKYKTKHEGIGEGDAMLAFVLGAMMPLIFLIHNIELSRLNLVQLLAIFLLSSSLIGLVMAGVMSIIKTQKKKIGEQKAIVMPFVPSMILAFWVLSIFAQKLFLTVFPSIG